MKELTVINIITLNVGSSSIKFASFECTQALKKLKYGSVSNINSEPVLSVYESSGNPINRKMFEKGKKYSYFFDMLFEHIASSHDKIRAVGHRVVHGGTMYKEPIIIKQSDIAVLKKLSPFAPLHQPYNLEAIEIIQRLMPNLVQIAAFDTAFHRTKPAIADLYAIPRKISAAGVYRYGFHGLSYEYILHKVNVLKANKLPKRMIIAHLGSGASMCAIRDGISIDTSMGLSALDGLMMGTRCGSIDPGVLLYLMKSMNMNANEIEQMLYNKSGLLGVSEMSQNMEVLLKSNDKKAKEAIALFVYKAKRELGGLVSILGGLDMLVFTGGIGENSPEIREAICQDMEWLGIYSHSKSESNVEVCVIPTDEEWIIASHTYNLVS